MPNGLDPEEEAEAAAAASAWTCSSWAKALAMASSLEVFMKLVELWLWIWPIWPCMLAGSGSAMINVAESAFEDEGRLQFLPLCKSKAQPGEIVKFQTCRPPDVHPHRKMNWQYNVHGNHEISLVAKDHLCITNDWSRQDGAGELKLAECSGSEDQKYNFIEGKAVVTEEMNCR